MKSKIRFKGKLRSYLCWPLLLTIPLILADIGLYFYDVATGIVLSGFIVIYFTVEISLYYYNKPHLTNEIINFATQYATVQKRLLRAGELIREGVPVMKAAEQAGFPEYSTFLRAFQSTFHTSPKNFK